MNKFVLSRKSLALITSFITLSNLAPSVAAVTTQPENSRIVDGINITTLDNKEYQRKVISDNLGQPTITQLIVSILEDARGPCLGGSRCRIAFTDDGKIGIEDRFKSLELDESRVGEYALSISGDSNKARILAIIENRDNNYEYTNYILDKFMVLKQRQMDNRGLENEAAIANSAILKNIGKFTAIAMNPHAAESMRVIEDGLGFIGG